MKRSLVLLIALVATLVTPAFVGSTPASALAPFTSVTPSPHANYTCALNADGVAYCWGQNNVGQLGDGTTIDKLTPVLISGGISFKKIVPGKIHTCGLSATGSVYCWGSNNYGELGNGTTTSTLVPTLIPGFTFTDIGVGEYTSCGIVSGSGAYCWGWDGGDGRLGSNGSKSSPAAVSLGGSLVSLAVGYKHSCGLNSSGVAYCWEAASRGYVETEPTQQASMPSPLRALLLSKL